MPTSRTAAARRLALESAVIIASILAAFALDTWWSDIQERREEQETLRALHTEFGAAKDNLLHYRGLQERILMSVGSISDSIDLALREGRGNVVLPDTALGWAWIGPTVTVSLGTLRGLISSGRLWVVRDRELRTALGSWGIELAELAEEETSLRDLAVGDVDRVFRTRINTTGLWSAAADLFNGVITLEDASATRSVPVDTESLGVLVLRRNLLSHAIEEYDPLLAEVDTILSLIERSLDSGEGR